LTTWRVPDRFELGGGPGVAGETGTGGGCGTTDGPLGLRMGAGADGMVGGRCATAAIVDSSNAAVAEAAKRKTFIACPSRLIPASFHKL
jgi:hypothetical protein